MLYGLVVYLLPLVSATALTYKLSPNEKACFFSYVEEKGAKLAFYFAVNSLADAVILYQNTKKKFLKLYEIQFLMHTL